MYRDIQQKEIKIHKTLGYLYFLDIKHPLASGDSGFVYYHRHVLSIHLNRWVTPEEIVHHINEDKLDNNISNLCILSRAEHATLHSGAYLSNIYCKFCTKEFKPAKSTTKYCSNECRNAAQVRITDITKEELEWLIWTKPYTLVGKHLGITDSGVKKVAKRLNCIMPPSRFHVKILDVKEKIKQYEEHCINVSN